MKTIVKLKAFKKLAQQAGISDDDLLKAVDEIAAGLIDASLGGNVYKKRIAAGNRGKRGGGRTIIATNLDDRWFFMYCYLKSEISNISPQDLAEFKGLAKILLSLSDDEINKAILFGKMEKVNESKE